MCSKISYALVRKAIYRLQAMQIGRLRVARCKYSVAASTTVCRHRPAGWRTQTTMTPQSRSQR
jgi:hypothetical protein